MSFKEFIRKNKIIIIVTLAFILFNVIVFVAWKMTHSKDDKISPSTKMDNPTETNNNKLSEETEQSNTIQKEEPDGTICIYDRNTEKILTKKFTDGTIGKYNDNGELIELTFIAQNGDILKYDPQTKKVIQQTVLKINSDKPLFVVEYDKNTGNIVKQTKYQDNEDIVQFVIEYNPEKKDQRTKETILFKNDDGIDNSIVLEYDPITGNKLKLTNYQMSNNCVNFVTDYNPAIQNKKTKIIFFQADGKTPLTVLTFDENTGNTQDQLLNKITDFKADGKTPSKVTEFNDKGKKEKYIQYKDDENIIEVTMEYDPTTGKLIKETTFKGDGETPLIVSEFDKTTGNKIQQTDYQNDKDVVETITTYNPESGKAIEEKTFKDDGINPLIMSIYDKDTGNIIEYREYQDEANLIKCLYTYNPNIKERKKQEKHFKSDGTSLSIVVDFDENTGNEIKITQYQDNEDKIENVIEYDPQVKDKITKSTKYKPDGINPLKVYDYDENTGNLTKKTEYWNDSNNHVKTITTYNPATEAIIETTNYDQNGIIITNNNYKH